MFETSEIHTAERDAPIPYGRIAWRLIPFLLLCYLTALIDRLNLGFAKLQFLADLRLDESVYGIAAGILYLGYILFEVPSNLLLARTDIRRTLLRIMVLWGLVTMALAFASDRYGFYALRFLLGAAEAGFFPGIVLYLTTWFPEHYRGRVLSLFAVGVPLSGVISGPISGLVMTHLEGVAGFRGWQWLFLVEGGPAIVLGVAAFFYLPDGPEAARFLSSGDRARLAQDLAAAERPGRRGLAWSDPRVLSLAFVYFAFYALQSLLLLWVPTLLRAAGVASLVEIGWRAGAISFAGVIGMVALGVSSDLTGARRLHVVGSGTLGALCFLLLPLGRGNPDVTTALIAGAAAMIFGFLALFWSSATAVLGRARAPVTIAFVSSVGALGAALAPTFIGVTKDWTGSFTGAVDTLAGVMLLAMVLLAYTLAPAREARGAHPAALPAE